MAWEEPVTDWDSLLQEGVDGDDFNRIEGNIEFLGQGSPIQDMDGNSYPTTIINGQQWTTEPWRSTKYADGSAIPLVADQTAWDALTTGAYCEYDGFITKYGRLYNFYAAAEVPNAMAPEGWRVSTYDDVEALMLYLQTNGYRYDNTAYNVLEIPGYKIAKAMASIGNWEGTGGSPGNVDIFPWQNNSSLLNIKPCGKRETTFSEIEYHAEFWTKGTATIQGFRLQGNNASVIFTGQVPATSGRGVVMVKDL